VLGAYYGGSPWGSLGYRDENSVWWGLYTPNDAYVGGFRMPTGAAAGEVLTCDANGVGTWQPATAGIGGVGTTGYVPKFTAATTLGNSPISCTSNVVSVAAQLTAYTGTTRVGFFESTLIDDATHVVHAEVFGTGTEDPIAVYGLSVPSAARGYGGYFQGGRAGVYGLSCVVGSSRNVGMHTEALYGNSNWGIYSFAGGGWPGGDFAGYFDGDVNVTGVLYRSGGGSRIDHPLDPANKYLCHSSVESADMMNVYSGNATLDGNGEAWVELPEWFETVNGDCRYQLTAVGAPGPNLYVAEKISGNRFRIAGGVPGAEVSWQITGIRRDPFAQAHRIPVEPEKPSSERGLYLDPELYGQPETQAIGYDVRTAAREAE
jgi:hypothetical protein